MTMDQAAIDALLSGGNQAASPPPEEASPPLAVRTVAANAPATSVPTAAPAMPPPPPPPPVPPPPVRQEPVAEREPPPAPVATLAVTGNSEIDKKMGGGIPFGSLSIIEGESDSGKSVLTQQIIQGTLEAGAKIVLYSTEDTPTSFIRQMQSLNLDVMDFFLLGRLNVYSIPNTFENEGAFGVLLNHISQRKEYDLFIVDSLTSLILHAPEAETLNFFTGMKKLCDSGRTIIMTVHSFALDEQLLTRIRSMCDGHFRMRVEDAGIRLIKVLEVAKIRGASKMTGNIISFDVEPGFGMKLIPIAKARA